MTIEFTAHNVRLDEGPSTKPDVGFTMDAHPWFVSARRVLEAVFPGDRSRVRLADLGCLEGGYSVEFARLGFQVLGLEVRESNLAACRYVKSRTNLANLEFVCDDAWNIARYGGFDVIFCCGLLYHLDRPRRFLQLLSSVTTRLLILQTHFSTEQENTRFALSAPAVNEGLPGRWYTEFADEEAFRDRESAKWAAWGNRRSFWVQREYLLQTIYDVGFDLVLEQYDHLAPDVAGAMTKGHYCLDQRGAFIGMKAAALPHAPDVSSEPPRGLAADATWQPTR